MLWIDYISYLWYIANSYFFFLIFVVIVVNWLRFVSLIYRRQWDKFDFVVGVRCELTTFRIFDISQTVHHKWWSSRLLLWIDYISYLWYIANSYLDKHFLQEHVVNWLHFVSLIYRKQLFFLSYLCSYRCELTTFRIFDISQTVG